MDSALGLGPLPDGAHRTDREPVPRTPAPIVFGPPDRPLHGLHYSPCERQRSVGVVLCNPLGYEAMCTHRSYRVLAERLTDHGYACLRFDYDGTGDSAGRFDDPGRLQAWLRSVGQAVDELRRRSGVERVVLFGVRFGGTLAALAAAGRDDVQGLALWAPATSGRAYVREMRAFRLIRGPKVGIPNNNRSDATEEIAGYPYDAETLSSMSAVDLLDPEQPATRRTLVLTRDDLPGSEARFAAHLEATGAHVTLSRESGYANMMRDPQESVVPSKALDAVVDWLDVASERVAPAPGELGERAIFNAKTFKETATFFSGPGDRRLFGVTTEPIGGAPADRPAILFLNVGANHHVGPNRMYVLLARDLAERGQLSLRFDLGGLGDSALPPGSPENRLYSKDSVEDVKAAMAFIRETTGTNRFVLVGLCSGAYLAFHTAVEDPRVVGQVLLNPQTFHWKEGDSLELSVRRSFLSTRYYARAIFDPEVWLRTLRGDVNVRGVARALRGRLVERAKASAVNARARLAGNAAPRSDVERAFVMLSDRGVESFLVFSFSDGGLDMIERHLGSDARRMRGRHNFELAIVEGADHTFTPLPSQDAVYQLIVRRLTTRFG